MRLRRARSAACKSPRQKFYADITTNTVFQHQAAQETLPLNDSSLHSEQAHHRLQRQSSQDQCHVYYVYADQVEFRISRAE